MPVKDVSSGASVIHGRLRETNPNNIMDQIKGTVNEVIDHNTFWMNVTWRSAFNKHPYKDLERIQLSEDKTPELGPVGATYVTNALLLKPGDKLHCNIQARDVYGRVVADVWKF